MILGKPIHRTESLITQHLDCEYRKTKDLQKKLFVDLIDSFCGEESINDYVFSVNVYKEDYRESGLLCGKKAIHCTLTYQKIINHQPEIHSLLIGKIGCSNEYHSA